MVIVVPRCDACDELGWAIGKGMLYLWLLISPYLTTLGMIFLITILTDDPSEFQEYIGIILGPLIGGLLGLTILIVWMVSSARAKGIKEGKFINNKWLIANGIIGGMIIAYGLVDMFSNISYYIGSDISGIVGGLVLQIPAIVRLIYYLMERSGKTPTQKVRKSEAIPSYTPEPVEEVKIFSEEVPVVQGKKPCSHCGHNNEADAKFCLNCGAEV